MNSLLLKIGLDSQPLLFVQNHSYGKMNEILRVEHFKWIHFEIFRHQEVLRHVEKSKGWDQQKKQSVTELIFYGQLRYYHGGINFENGAPLNLSGCP